jgi:hypothetical protein
MGSVRADDGAGHNDFTDLTFFARELWLDHQRRAGWSLGSIDAGKAIGAERTYVVRFFERRLRGYSPERVTSLPGH